MEETLYEPASSRCVTLRYHGDPAMSGVLEPASGAMTWTTDNRDHDVAVGQFAVIDGVVVMSYEDDDLRWLRVGGRLLAWSDVWLSMEEGLSAQELVIETVDETIRLRADGDPVAVSYATELATLSTTEHEPPVVAAGEPTVV